MCVCVAGRQICGILDFDSEAEESFVCVRMCVCLRMCGFLSYSRLISTFKNLGVRVHRAMAPLITDTCVCVRACVFFQPSPSIHPSATLCMIFSN